MVRGYDRAGGARAYGNRTFPYGKHAGHAAYGRAYSGDNAGDRSGGYDDRRYALGHFSHATRLLPPLTPSPREDRRGGGGAGRRGGGGAFRRGRKLSGKKAS